jgi:hypothetical protein
MPPGISPASDGDAVSEVLAVEVEDGGRFVEDEGMKYGGPRRLRLRVAVRPGQERLALVYYFERIGEVRLPA